MCEIRNRVALPKNTQICSFKNLYIMGKAIKTSKHIIDTDAIPTLPFDGAVIKYHKKSGKIILDSFEVKRRLSPNQQEIKRITGKKLFKQFEEELVFNACVLDYLLKKPSLIPKDLKKDTKGNIKYTSFLGTIFEDNLHNLYFRRLYFKDRKWQSDHCWVAGNFGSFIIEFFRLSLCRA